MGLGTYFGNLVSQNGKGHLLGHVKDLGEDSSKIDEVRIYRTNARYVYFFYFYFFWNLIYPKGLVFLFFLYFVHLKTRNISRILLISLLSLLFTQTTQTGKLLVVLFSRLGFITPFPFLISFRIM